MTNPANTELIQKAAEICASDQVDDLRALVPVQVPPDSNIKKCFISGFRHSGGTLLHVCAHFGSVQCAATPLLLASWQGSLQIVISLLRSGADPNVQEECTFFPIHKAAIRGYAEIIHHLIKGGTDPNCIDYEGYTPLHLAAKSGHYEACDTLYRAGADPMKANHFMFTPIDFAVRFNFDDIVSLLHTPRSKLVSALSGRGEPPKSVSSFRDSVSSTRNKDPSSIGKTVDTP